MTRVARVTGLDRAGVKVACAIRPGGHVLQISNGKGATLDRARRSALSEAAELWAAERLDASRCVFASLRELASSGADAWDPMDLGSGGEPLEPRLWTPDMRIAWVPARELFSDAEVLVPAQAVFCPPPGSAQLGPAVVRWSSNGMGAHPHLAPALEHALLEAIERDQLARSLPEGWTPRELRRRKVSVRELGPGLEAHVFDLSADIALPVAGALLLDREDGPVPVAAGYACARSYDEAASGAVLEAAQSRLTDVHGAREDTVPMDRADAAALRHACLRARALSRPRRRTGGEPLRALWKAGYRRAAVVELATTPLRVVKVIVPGLRVSELL